MLKTDEYCVFQMFIDGKLHENDSLATGVITVEAHLVSDLKVNMLIGTDTITPQRLCIDLSKQSLVVGSCQNLQAPLKVRTREQPHFKRTIRFKASVVIPAHSTIKIPISYNENIPNDRDFLFEPQCTQNLGKDEGVFAHVVDATLASVQLRNSITHAVTLPKRVRLGSVIEYQEEGAYMMIPEAANLAAGGWMYGNGLGKS